MSPSGLLRCVGLCCIVFFFQCHLARLVAIAAMPPGPRSHSSDSVPSNVQENGSQSSVSEARNVHCTLVGLSGEVLVATEVKWTDTRRTMGHFFSLAKTALSVQENEVHLIIGPTQLTAPQDAFMPFFRLPAVQDAISESLDQDPDDIQVRIQVVRVMHENRSRLYEHSSEPSASMP